MHIGFSTGSLALGDFRTAIEMVRGSAADVVELSALRENELGNLIDALDTLDLGQFQYVSFHAPSKLRLYTELQLVECLQVVARFGFPIIVHPDIIHDPAPWRVLGNLLCIENMDKRKPIGRTVADLEQFFTYLPEASFCLDLAHARQVDPTMTEAFMMIKKFGNRLVQLHVSDVNATSVHEPLNFEALLAFCKIGKYIDPETPIVLESPVRKEGIKMELKAASLIFNSQAFEDFLGEYGLLINKETNRIWGREIQGV